MEKMFGRITDTKFGSVKDYPFLFGFELYFRLEDGTSISCGSIHMFNISKECQWDNQEERNSTIVDHIDRINKILKDAKVNYVSELINKPVIVTIENNTFKNFRILKEVL